MTTCPLFAGTFTWTNAASGYWSTNKSWTPNGQPGSADDVLFYDQGATNTQGAINNTVDANFTIRSLTYGNTNNFHTTQISSGNTLSITGTNGLYVGTGTDNGTNQTVYTTITGPGKLVLSNANAALTVCQAASNSPVLNQVQRATLDMSGLNTFTATVSNVLVGVFGSIQRPAGTLYLAKTNSITALSSGGSAGIDLGDMITFNDAAYNYLYLGQTNAIFADTITTGGPKAHALMAFNPAFTNNPAVYIRGTNGSASRVTTWGVGDNGAITGSTGSSTTGTNDFSGGTVDALVGTMYLGRAENATGAGTSVGVLTFTQGTFDANTIEAGYQTLSGSVPATPYEGDINVNGSSATLVVNTTLRLAYSQGAACDGTLTISNGTVKANTIVAGGGTSTIAMTNGTLIVTNTIGSAASPLSSLAITNSTLQLSVASNTTNVVTTSLTTGGANTIKITTLPTITTTPKQYVLIDYSGSIGGSGYNFSLATLPNNYGGYVSNNASHTSVDLVITTTNNVASQLAITSINGGSSPAAGTSFSVVVQSQNSGGQTAAVVADTAVTISLNTGSGTLGGTLTGTILAGTSSVTISGITYTKAESGVILHVVRTSGDSLSAANSSSFTVVPGPVSASQSSVISSPASVTANGVAASTVTVTLLDANNNPVSGKTVALGSNGGNSTISAASGASDNSGVVTFTVSDPIAETVTYTATNTTDGITITDTASVTFTPIAWYNNTWLYRKLITIYHTNVAGNLTNFPVLISEIDSNLAAHAQTNGNDILFTSSDGTNKLAHEIETYTNSDGSLVAWVNVPSLSATTNTLIYMYYGNATATNQQNVTAVWDSDFRAVYHLKEHSTGAVGEFADSTSRHNNGTGSGFPAQTPGQIGGAESFNSPDYIDIPSPNLALTNTTTISLWQYGSASQPQQDAIIQGYDVSTNRVFSVNLPWSDSKIYWDCGNSGTSTFDRISQAATNNQFKGQWNYWAFTKDAVSGQMLIFLNGSPWASGTGLTRTMATITAFRIGSSTVNSQNYSGYIDECRVSDLVRSTNWIATEFNNQNSPGTFSSFAPEEDEPPTQLAITSVNGGSSPTAGAAFSVVVQARNASGTAAPVITNTSISLSLNAGGGTLGGTLTGTITAGSTSVTLSAVTYTKAESGVILTASRTAGDSLSSGNSSSFTVNAGPFAQLQVLMPGETAAPGTASGKTGSPTAQTVGTAFNATVNSVDANWNPISTNDTASISSSDGSAVLPGNAALVGGTRTFSITFMTAGSQTVTATDVTHGGITANTGTSTTVNKGNQTITFPSPGNQTYGVSPITLGATASSGLSVSYSVTSGPATVSGNTLTITGAGSVTIQANQAGNANWNAASAVNQTITISNKVLTVSGLTANNKVYDKTTTATITTNGYSFTGVVGGDTVTLLTNGYTATFASANVGNGISVTVSGLTLGGASAGNYTLTQPTLSANITGKSLTVSGLTANNKVYDQTTTATIATNGYSFTGVMGGDTVTLLTNGYTATFASANVGNGISVTVSGLTLGGASAGNYTLTQPTLSANITGKPLTISGLTANNKVYDQTTTATIATNGYSFTGVIGGDTVTLVTNGYTATFASANVGNGISVTVSGLTLGGASAGNYTLTQPTLSANITGKPLTVSGLTANNKVYDQTTIATIATNGYSFTGVIGGDTVTLLTNGYTATFASANVGNGISVTVSGLTLGGTSAGNYTLTQPTLSANITGKPLTVSGLTANNKVYDQTTTATIATNGYSFTGVMGGDTVTLLTNGYTATFASANVGNGISVTVGGLTLGGASAGNYTLTQPTLSANITGKPLTVSGLTANNKVYDQTTTATIATNGYSFTGVIGGDTVTLLTNGYTATFASANVANGISVTVSGLTLGGASAGNYTLTPPTLSANITGKSLTVSGLTANSKVYDQTTTATIATNGYSFTGVINGDTVTLVTNGYTATFASANVGNGISVTVSGLTLGGASAGNYTLTQPTLSANITGKPLTVSGLTANNKVYDQTTTATISTNGYSFTGVINGDTVTLVTNGYTATFASANVGNGISVTVSGLTLGGASAGNYTLTQPTLSANITGKPLTVSGLTANNKVYDQTTTATIATNGYSFTGVVSGDTVTLLTNGYTATFASANVGNGISVTVSGLTLGGASAGNYTLTQPTLSANITGKPLTVFGLTANNKVYDQTTTATIATNGYSFTGVLGGDTVTLLTNGYTATFASANVGNGISVTVSGLTLGGASAGNYTLTQPTLSANITGKPLTVSGLTANSKVYDQTTTATITTNGYSFTGVVGGDTVTLLTNGYTATFASANVGNGVSVTVSGLTLGGASAGNYTLTQPTLSANITARPLTVSATGMDKVYDGTTSATVTLSDNRIAGDLLTNSYSSAAFSDKNVGSGKTVSVSGINITGPQAGDYTFNTNTTTTANITAATLTVTANNTNRVYGAPNPVFTASYSGFLGGDTSAVISGSPGFSTAANSSSTVAGSPYSILVTNGTLNATNYSFSFVSGQLTITVASSTNAVSTSANPSPTGSNVTFTATLTGVSPSAGVPTGTVLFRADGTALGSAVSLVGGVATRTTASLSHGTHVITAEYAGDANFLGSTNTLSPNQVINTAPTAQPCTLQRFASTPAKVRISTVLAGDSDPDSDSIGFVSAASTSTAGGTVSTNGAWIHYLPPPGFTNTDSFAYIIQDNGGLSATNLISTTVLAGSSPAQNTVSVANAAGGGVTATFQGIPGRLYSVQSTASLQTPNWQILGTQTADASGRLQFTDPAGSTSVYYRITYP